MRRHPKVTVGLCALVAVLAYASVAPAHTGSPLRSAAVAPMYVPASCMWNHSFYYYGFPPDGSYLSISGGESGCPRGNLSVIIELLEDGNYWKTLGSNSCSNATSCVVPSSFIINCLQPGHDYVIRVIGSHPLLGPDGPEQVDVHFRSCLG